MAWETRERGGRYYYRSVREGDRVRKEYVGTGEIAEAIAHTDERIRRHRQEQRARWRTELERMEELAGPVLELSEMAEVLARAALVAGGYRMHKGAWRMRRDA
jgi:hypothetical protein